MILRDAPFFCSDKKGELKAWLGDGYYFWESFILLAHWWGKVHYRRKNKHYAICSTIFDCNDGEFLDLINNPSQIEDVQKVVDYLVATEEYKADKFTAQFVINFLRTKTPFPYKAIRVYGRDCAADKSITQYRLNFNNNSSMHLCPEIQICVIDKSTIKLPVEIIYSSDTQSLDNYTV
ncbi:MAG: hypothetical protein K2L27_05120 [Muribaculaceae bacterium]|nr:hypothetical protein [Muribaculaceae bacterium]